MLVQYTKVLPSILRKLFGRPKETVVRILNKNQYTNLTLSGKIRKEVDSFHNIRLKYVIVTSYNVSEASSNKERVIVGKYGFV